jgi:antitoxin VapB
VALNIKNTTAEELARQLADATGETITEAVIVALRERLAAIQQRRGSQRRRLLSQVAEIQGFVRSLPDRDARTPDEILGYDAAGLPT